MAQLSAEAEAAIVKYNLTVSDETRNRLVSRTMILIVKLNG